MPVGLNHAAAAPSAATSTSSAATAGAARLDDEVAALLRYDPRRDRWTRLPTCRPRRARSPPASSATACTRPAAPRRPRRARHARDLRLPHAPLGRGPDMPIAREHLAGAVARRPLLRARRARAPGRATSRASSATTRAPPLEPRARHAQAARRHRGRDGRAGAIVVVGGEEAAGTIAEVERLRPGARRWRALPDLPTPRHGLGAVADRPARLRARGRRRSPGSTSPARSSTVDLAR